MPNVRMSDNRSIRTNNDAEGWHNRLNKSAPHDHRNVYRLVKLLHEEAPLLPLQVRLIMMYIILSIRVCGG